MSFDCCTHCQNHGCFSIIPCILLSLFLGWQHIFLIICFALLCTIAGQHFLVVAVYNLLEFFKQTFAIITTIAFNSPFVKQATDILWIGLKARSATTVC